jgi:hypothetical protein
MIDRFQIIALYLKNQVLYILDKSKIIISLSRKWKLNFKFKGLFKDIVGAN